VIGSDKDHCSEAAYQMAYRVGIEIAKRGAVLISGGLGGVMEAASHGAQSASGLVIGILPQDEKSKANPYCDVVIATGLGHARDFLTAYSADVVIVVEGGTGSMIEAAAAYQKKIPIVALKGTGGTADKIVGTHLDERKIETILGESSPEEAVSTALSIVESTIE
jgi:uncharacterized protein (TIGR00725 family)